MQIPSSSAIKGGVPLIEQKMEIGSAASRNNIQNAIIDDGD
jgi:hypothetical protein